MVDLEAPSWDEAKSNLVEVTDSGQLPTYMVIRRFFGCSLDPGSTPGGSTKKEDYHGN